MAIGSLHFHHFPASLFLLAGLEKVSNWRLENCRSERHKKLKDNLPPRQHSSSLCYANKSMMRARLSKDCCSILFFWIYGVVPFWHDSIKNWTPSITNFLHFFQPYSLGTKLPQSQFLREPSLWRKCLPSRYAVRMVPVRRKRRLQHGWLHKNQMKIIIELEGATVHSKEP